MILSLKKIQTTTHCTREEVIHTDSTARVGNMQAHLYLNSDTYIGISVEDCVHGYPFHQRLSEGVTIR